MAERTTPEADHLVMQSEYWGGHDFSDNCKQEPIRSLADGMIRDISAGLKLDDFFRKLDRAGLDRFTIVDVIDPNKYPQGSIILIGRETLFRSRGKIEYADTDIYWGTVVGKDGQHGIVTFPANERGTANTASSEHRYFEQTLKVDDVHHLIGVPLAVPDTISRIKGLKLCKIEPPGTKRRLGIRLPQLKTGPLFQGNN